MFPCAYKLKNKFQLEEVGVEMIFLYQFRSRCSWRFTKCPSLITKVLLQVVRDIIDRMCYQRYEKCLEQQKGRPNCNVCAAKENVEEELPVFDYRFI